MKKLLIVMLSLLMAVGISACGSDDKLPTDVPEQPGKNDTTMKLQISVGSNVFTATLTDNAAAKAFEELLPMTLNMSELNNNEKFAELSRSLPTIASNPGTIHNGDIMLYGARTVVIFYKTFSSSYSYTRIGKIDNPDGLANALGTGSVSVVFEEQAN